MRLKKKKWKSAAKFLFNIVIFDAEICGYY